jgi:hypothetical protein
MKSCLEDREHCDDEWLGNIKLGFINPGLGFIWEFEQFDTKLIILIKQ